MPPRLERMTDLTLIAPDPVAPVSPDQASGLVVLDAGQRAQVQAKVDAFLADLLSIAPHDPGFAAKATQITTIGQKDMAALSSRFLSPGAAPDQAVAGALGQLRALIERLDPARQGDLLKPRKLLGILPRGNRIGAYFDSYRSAQDQIQTLLTTLAQGLDALAQDNIAIETERARIREQMTRLEEMVLVVTLLDTRLEEAAARSDPARAQRLREEPLFHARQRRMDLLTHMAVVHQGWLALDLIRRNNLELIKGVERASTTTIAALRVAVTVAQALEGQRLVLARISALNTAAAHTMSAAQDQSATARAQLTMLESAFADIHATMDTVDTFRAKALGNMATTLSALPAR